MEGEIAASGTSLIFFLRNRSTIGVASVKVEEEASGGWGVLGEGNEAAAGEDVLSEIGFHDERLERFENEGPQCDDWKLHASSLSRG